MAEAPSRYREGAPVESDIVARLRSAGCVFAEDEARLLVSAARTPGDLDAMVERRIAGLPLELILGWAEFCGLRIAVDPRVFVPRRRTEFLARQAAGCAMTAADRAGPVVVVDLCCGTGAVGVAVIAHEGLGDRIELHATDIDPAAVQCARRNVGNRGRVYEGDLYESLPAALRGRVDVLVANAPYVPTEAIALMPPEARTHEPQVALDGGADGTDVLRRVIMAGPEWLAPTGTLLVETSEQQAPSLVRAATAAGFVARVADSSESDATVVIATRPELPIADDPL